MYWVAVGKGGVDDDRLKKLIDNISTPVQHPPSPSITMERDDCRYKLTN